MIKATDFGPDLILGFNQLLRTDLKSKLEILSAHTFLEGLFLDTTATPTSTETAFVLKHVRRLFPALDSDKEPVATITPSSTSFLRIINIPIIPNLPKDEWMTTTRHMLSKQLDKSPVGKLLAKNLKHKPRIMRNSPHSDSCTAWIDIHDTMSGANAAALIGKFIYFGGFSCRIVGAKPHPGSLQCTRCQKWGHHESKCRSQGVRCPLCGGPHREANHTTYVKVKQDEHHCVNCMSSKHAKNNHASTDRKCPFWQNRFDCDWLKRQFKHD
jgi:hypothetical protein